MTHKPFIYLSAGVSNPVFIETLELAAESGTKFNGVLCGRATWKDGIVIYASKGAQAFRDWLETTGVENISNVNKALEAATPGFTSSVWAAWRSWARSRIVPRRFSLVRGCGFG